MRLSELTESGQITVLLNTAGDPELGGVQLLPAQKFQPGVIYAGTRHELPSVLPDRDDFVLLLRVTSDASREQLAASLPRRCCCLISSAPVDVLLNLALSLLQQEHAVYAAEQRLTAAFLRGAPMQELTELTASILDRAVCIANPYAHILARASDSLPAEPGSPYEEFLTMDNFGVFIAGRVEEDSDWLTFLAKMHRQDFTYVFHLKMQMRVFLAELRVGGTDVAWLVCPERSRPMTRADERILIHLARLCDRKMEETIPGGLQQRNEVFMHALLNGQMDIISGWELLAKGSYQLLYLRFPADEPSRLASLLRELSPVLRDHFYAIYENAIVILCNLRPADPLPEDLMKAIRNHSGTADACLGISTRTDRLSDAPRLLWEAEQAVEAGLHTGQEQPVFFETVTVPALLRAAGAAEKLERFLLPELAAMQKADSETGHDHLRTLYWFLQLNQSAAATAEKLFVHRNTLLRHLNEIRAALPRSLEDGSYVLQLRLSLEIMKYLRIFTE